MDTVGSFLLDRMIFRRPEVHVVGANGGAFIGEHPGHAARRSGRLQVANSRRWRYGAGKRDIGD